MQLIRHGDIILRLVKAVPVGAKRIADGGNSYVVAEGESTGHRHVLEVVRPAATLAVENLPLPSPAIEIWEMGGIRFLTVKEECKITHQQHNTLTVPPGTYRIDIQEERDPFLDNIRQVAD